MHKFRKEGTSGIGIPKEITSVLNFDSEFIAILQTVITSMHVLQQSYLVAIAFYIFVLQAIRAIFKIPLISISDEKQSNDFNVPPLQSRY